MRRAAMASVTVAAVLSLSKAAVWLVTGSVTMLASLTDSVLDLIASVATFFGVRTALAPPDFDHRFGHGKAEGLAALFQAAVMAGSATFLLFESAARVATPGNLSLAWSAIAVSLLAIALTVTLVAFQRWVVARTGSIAIAADRLHYMGDLMLNLGAIAGVALAAYGGIAWADGAFGVAIALWIARNAYEVGRAAVDMLMDKEFSEPARERIFNIVMGNAQVRGLHDLKTRSSGLREFIQLHIEVDGHLSLRQAHLAATEVEAAIGEAFPRAEIIINVDPLGLEKPNLTARELAAE